MGFNTQIYIFSGGQGKINLTWLVKMLLYFCNVKQKRITWSIGNSTRTEAMRMTNNFRTIIHESQEENLLAAKRAVRRTRKAYMHRRAEMAGDVIDIIIGGKIIERHLCRTVAPCPEVRTRTQFCVEEMALYQ